MSFPDDLACIGWKLDSLAVQYGDSRQKYNYSKGYPTFRRTLSRTPKLAALTSARALTMNEAARFQRFWEEDTSFGSWLFWMPDPNRHNWPTGLLTEDGETIHISAYWLCQFGDEPPTESRVGNKFRISFPVLILPR